MRLPRGKLLSSVPVFVLATIAATALLAACGGSSDPPAAPTSVPPTTAPEATPTATPPATATPLPVATEPAGSAADEQFALGKEIFEKTAGGVGCAFCHGMRGEGDGPSGLGAPPNAGKDRARLKWALGGGETDAMSFIKLSSKEMDAVLVYLKYLGEQAKKSAQ